MAQRIKSMLHKILSSHKIILASQSPRRREIFELLKLDYEVKSSDIAEPMTDEDPALQVMRHARNKARTVSDNELNPDLIVAADTVVVCEARILGKPETKAEAADFLSILSNREHTVITGVSLIGKGGSLTCYEQTQVWFASLRDSEIEEYISTSEPMDKAGAYGIQGYGSQFITRVEGCFFNVMGFPIRRFYEMVLELDKAGKL